MSRIKINFKIIGFYLFGLAVLYLAGSYIQWAFLYLFYVYLLLPVIAFTHTVISFISLKFHQDFSTEHPVKGQEVVYTLSFHNESFLPILNLHVQFKPIQSDYSERLEDLYLFLAGHEQYKNEFTIKCPYRGIYMAGLETLSIQDVLGWVTFYLSVWHKEFYVYPRIINLLPAFYDVFSGTRSTGSYKGSLLDHTMLRGLTVYKTGQSVKHLAWKKLISIGQPFLKSFEKTARPGMDIYIDMRRDEEVTPLILEREDCSIEIAVALVKYFLDHGITVSVHCIGKSAGNKRYDFTGSEPALFPFFHHSTINLFFQSTVSPILLFMADKAESSFSSNSILFITHIVDPEILEMTIESTGKALSVSAVLNQAGMCDKERQKNDNYLTSVLERGGSIFIVKDSETIKEDLEE